MSLIGLALVIALCIPILALVVDSPIGRALAKRLEREPTPGTRRDEEIAELKRRVDLLEGDVEIAQAAVRELRDQNDFLQRMLEEGPPRWPTPPLPPGGA
jgi:hypothetical protein